MNRFVKLTAVSLVCFVYFLLPYSIYAQIQQEYTYLRLNEIMPNPQGSDTDYEWIEIHNEYEEGFDMTGCDLDDKQIPENVFLEGESYLIFAKDLLDEDKDGKSFEKRWGNGSGEWGDSEKEDFQAVQLDISLKNSDDEVSMSCGEYEDTFEWTDASSGQSYSVDQDGQWTDKYEITPGRLNTQVPEIVYPDTIQISEVYPTPSEDEVEWLELYNWGDEPVDLLDWYIEDNTKKHTFGGIVIDPKDHLVFEEDELNITLNNSGEKLALFNPNEEEIDYFKYEDTDKYLSNIRKWNNTKYDEKIFQTKKPTKGSQNEYIDPENLFYDMKIELIAEVRKHEISEVVCTQGYITVEINKLGSKQFYIQDESGGIQVYLYQEEIWDGFKIGDYIKVLGELRQTNGEKRIYVKEEKAIVDLNENRKTKPHNMKTGQIDEKLEGQLVVLAGKIVETSGRSFYIDDGSGKIKILIKSSTDIETPSKKKGQYAAIIGVVSQYGDEQDDFRILPRQTSDILISNKPVSHGDVLAATGTNIFSIILGGFVLIVFSLIKIFRSRKL